MAVRTTSQSARHHDAVNLDAMLPIATLVLGAALTFVTESVRHRRTRREALDDALRSQRATACTAFLESAHSAAHRLGRTATGCPDPLPADSDVYWLTDSDVTQKLRNLEIVGGERVVSSARAVRQGLLDFRDAVRSGVVYGSQEYWAAHRPVAHHRDALIEAARAELLTTRL